MNRKILFVSVLFVSLLIAVSFVMTGQSTNEPVIDDNNRTNFTVTYELPNNVADRFVSHYVGIDKYANFRNMYNKTVTDEGVVSSKYYVHENTSLKEITVKSSPYYNYSRAETNLPENPDEGEVYDIGELTVNSKWDLLAGGSDMGEELAESNGYNFTNSSKVANENIRENKNVIITGEWNKKDDFEPFMMSAGDGDVRGYHTYSFRF